MKNIVLFASGSGTNAENIIRYFRKNQHAQVVAVFCNNAKALVLGKAKNLEVPTFVIDKTGLNSEEILETLHSLQTDLIVLAGFLLQFPGSIIKAYPNQIINIHPALLPKYGGKGMYGKHVHQAVLDNKESETGITIHYVNEHYDEGEIVFQKSVSITHCTSAEAIAQEVHQLEQQCFPQIIHQILSGTPEL